MFAFAFYLLKVTICSGILFGYYWLMLRNKIFHHYNRFFLLASIILSLALPLIQINVWHNADQPTHQGIKLLQVVNSSEYLDEIIIYSKRTNFTTDQALFLFYSLISFIFFGLFLRALQRIRNLFFQHQHSFVENIYLVNTTAKGTPFSFFKYIFWNNHIDPATPTGSQILKHELAHVQQRHSYDKLFINSVLIFYWCNPFFWLMRKEMSMIHEFMADKIAVEDSDTEAFAAMILQAAYPQHHFHLANPYFYSPIKRRLMMLTKNRNAKVGYIGRLLVLPLAVLIFAAFTLKAKTFKQSNQPYDGKTITVVLDAGHGGSDGGAVSQQGSIFEKDLNLAIIKKIQSVNSNRKIKILLTRETDILKTPIERVAFTKAANADLFISIHMAASSSIEDNSNSGLNIYIAKNNSSNMLNSQKLASALIAGFSSNYGLPVHQQPLQYQSSIRVLKDALCPAVLIETGYITNNKDLAYLQSDAAKEFIAIKILDAVQKYAVANEKGDAAIAIQKSLSAEEFTGSKADTIPENILKSIDKALVVVDGKAQISGFNFNSISPDDIESMNILKDKTAIDKYGKKGINGVIEIITKNQKAYRKNALKINKMNYDVIDTPAIAKNQQERENEPIFTKVEYEPKFPGGDSAWRNYLQKHINANTPVDEKWAAGTYKIVVQFIVDKAGNLSDIKTNDFPDSKTAQQCIDLIKKGPKWQPAMQNGNIVKAYKKQPITFIIEKQ